MTKEKLVEQLKIVAAMGDRQIEALANLLIDYFSEKDTKIGFTIDEEDKKSAKV